eukprot:Skav211137  [mRNA]  locus=scaffold4091:167674:169945:+ [translate_table: standard]
MALAASAAAAAAGSSLQVLTAVAATAAMAGAVLARSAPQRAAKVVRLAEDGRGNCGEAVDLHDVSWQLVADDGSWE